MLPYAQIPFSIDGAYQNNDENNYPLWKALDRRHSNDEKLVQLRNLDVVVMRISEVAARVTGEATTAGRKLAKVTVKIDKPMVVSREEF
ncbi:hypothetical protein L484_007871 [Morus notabilis]|uniref:Uncharacterized protein n=1 Tax=Morus notabilis TaxID=981085 RepID=W9QR05_9ROSA|nr:hypothetical protein L484_007871 [Morus notabilis]